jgi:D-3-phosphoglycerate dehydrogenase
MLSIAFTGLDHIDTEECQRRGIVVKNAAGYSTEAVAELAIALMIDLYRKVLENDAITRQCNRKGIMPGREISGKTIGIIGMGNIGQRVAKLANAFGCKVLAWNRTPKQIEGVAFVDKETLLKESDIVTLHIALNAETRDFITEKDFALLKPSSILINTARGPVVNETALANALKQGKIAGAATDVYGTEPPLKPENPLFDAPNLIMLPHIGFATDEAFVLRLGIVVRNVEEYLN